MRKIVNGLMAAMLVALCGLPGRVQAQTVTIVSDHLDIWDDRHEALFVGGVHLVREDFELYCDSLRAFYRGAAQGGGLDHALATGHVRLIQGDKKGMADKALIENDKQIVTLTGHAVMEQPDGRVQGETIVHDMAAKTTEVLKGGKSRVRLRFDDARANASPGSAPAKGKAAEKTPAADGRQEVKP